MADSHFSTLNVDEKRCDPIAYGFPSLVAYVGSIAIAKDDLRSKLGSVERWDVITPCWFLLKA